MGKHAVHGHLPHEPGWDTGLDRPNSRDPIHLTGKAVQKKVKKLV